jgi:NAD(P) transhydrogenase subunit alpha
MNICKSLILLVALLGALSSVGCDDALPPVDRSTSAENEPVEEASSHAMAFVSSVTIFVLAVFVGFEVITKVPPTLHTPLMSGSNAISGITLVGALVAAGNTESPWSAALGFVAVILATINVVGGFAVTGRMLAMFQRRP